MADAENQDPSLQPDFEASKRKKVKQSLDALSEEIMMVKMELMGLAGEVEDDTVALNLKGFERRLYNRFRIKKILLKLFLLEDARRNVGQGLIDVSLDGISGIVTSELKKDDGVNLEMEMPSRNEQLKVHGTIRWCKPLSEGRWKVGVRFSNVTVDDLTILKDWLRAAASES